MARLEAVSPEQGLSYSEANDNRKDKGELERPEVSKQTVNCRRSETRDDSHDCKHEKDVDTGEDSLHYTPWDVMRNNE